MKKHHNPWDLSGQEQAVLDHVSAGLENKRIAEVMGLSVKTVEVYRHRAIKRMQAPNSIRAAVLWDRFAMGREEIA